MAWLDRFKKQPKVNETLENTIIQNLTPTAVSKAMWRTGMWVVTNKGVGILFSMSQPAIVHLVNEQGETVNSLTVPLQSLRQATYKEIPLSRKAGITPERAFYLGYV